MATSFRLCCIKKIKDTSLIPVLLVKFICLLISDVILLPDIKHGG